MTWFITSEAHYEVIEELETQTDRGAAIIGSALLEERLSEALRSRLRLVGDIDDKLFEANGPFATFSGKIDAACALGFFGDQSRRDLHLIRKIRNKFAHILSPLSFSSPDIAAQCRELWLPQQVMVMGASLAPSKPRDQYLTAVNILNSLIWSEITSSITKDKGKVGEPYFLPW